MKTDADTDDMRLRRGVTFVSLIIMTLSSLSLMQVVMNERETYNKHKAAKFFRPSTHLVAHIVSYGLFSILEATIWSLVVYFLSGLSLLDGGCHFWKFWLIVCLVDLQASMMFRFIAITSSRMEVATTLVGLMIAIMVLFAGFLIPRNKFAAHWMWVYDINPMQWGVTALMINEFLSSTYVEPCDVVMVEKYAQRHPLFTKSTPCYVGATEAVGRAFLEVFHFLIFHQWLVASISMLLLWLFIWNMLAYLSAIYIRHTSATMQVLSVAKVATLAGGGGIGVQGGWDGMEEQHHVVVHVKSCIRFPPISLSWHDLSYTQRVDGAKKSTVQFTGISGCVRPGEMLLIAGGGAGFKETLLLNTLADWCVSSGVVGGQILVNKQPRVRGTFSRIRGYVRADPAGYPLYFTIHETLLLYASLRLPRDTPEELKRSFVKEVMELLEINSPEDEPSLTLLGSTANLEATWRYMIGCELVANPSILFLDEPLSALSAQSAFNIVNTLKAITRTGRAVIAKVSAPTLWELSVFDKVMSLDKEGNQSSFGPVNHGRGSTLPSSINTITLHQSPYRETHVALKWPDHHPLADGTVKVEGVVKLERNSMNGELANPRHIDKVERLCLDKGGATALVPGPCDKGYAATFATQLRVLTQLRIKQYHRNRHHSFLRVKFIFLISLLLGSVYFRVMAEESSNLSVPSGFIYIALILIAIANTPNIVTQIAAMKPAYERERLSNQYSSTAYGLALGIAEVPHLAVPTLLFCSIALNMIGIGNGSARTFFLFWMVLFEYVLCVTYFGTFVALLPPMVLPANAVINVILNAWFITAGLVINFDKIPRWYLWTFWANPVQYAMDALNILAFYCNSQSPLCTNNGTNERCRTDPLACPTCPCKRSQDNSNFLWEIHAEARSLDPSRLSIDMAVLLGMIVLFQASTTLVLKFTQLTKRV